MKRCPNCGNKINGHPNKKFCGSRCKDKYWNRVNPRGIYAHLNKEEKEFDPDDEMSIGEAESVREGAK